MLEVLFTINYTLGILKSCESVGMLNLLQNTEIIKVLNIEFPRCILIHIY